MFSPADINKLVSYESRVGTIVNYVHGSEYPVEVLYFDGKRDYFLRCCTKLQILPMKQGPALFSWERLDEHTSRIRVTKGWVVRSLDAMVFVPDEFHNWSIDNVGHV